MRDETAELRANSLRQKVIVDVVPLYKATKRCRGSMHSMERVAASRANGAPRRAGRMNDPVADHCAPARTAIRIEEIRETGPGAYPSQQRTAVLHDLLLPSDRMRQP